MNQFKWLVIGFILFGFVAHGQEGDSVRIFSGKGVFRSNQKVLDLSYQNLKEVPVIALNPEIETLILDNNQISALPPWIGDLKKLKILSLRNNKLSELNAVIRNCENLEQLYLSGNKELSDISVISTTQKLELIDVVDTKINELQPWVQMMDSLFYFKYTTIKDPDK